MDLSFKVKILATKKSYDIVEQVKDSFNVRTIRYNKPYTLLRSKNKTNKLQVFIYQPDALILLCNRFSAIVLQKLTKK